MEMTMPSRSTVVSAAASIGVAGSLNIVVSWVLWKYWSVDLPNDVAIAFTNILGALFHFGARMIEKMWGVDVDGDGSVNGQSPPVPTPEPPVPTPPTATTAEGKPA